MLVELLSSGGHARYINCTFDDANISHWICWSVELVNFRFTGRLSSVIFNGTVPDDDRLDIGRQGNKFRGNDFSHAMFRGVDFRTEIDLSLQKLPESPDFFFVTDVAAALAAAPETLQSWDHASAQREAAIVLTLMRRDFEDGQQQQFVRIDDYPPPMRQPASKLLEAIAGSRQPAVWEHPPTCSRPSLRCHSSSAIRRSGESLEVAAGHVSLHEVG